MAVVVPAVNLQYFQQPLPKGRRALVSSMEISCLTAPKFLGTVEAEEIATETYMGFLMAAGNETTVAAEQVSWQEKPIESHVNQIVGTNLVTRAGNDFTINAAAIQADPRDIDACRPEDARFFVAVGQRFLVVDATGERNIGKVTAISTDGKTITAVIRDENTAWTVGTTNLDIIFLGHNLDHCECPPCIGWKNYAPTYENSFYSDGVCAEYCEETMVAEGGWEAFPERNFGGLNLYPDENLDQKMKLAAGQMDAALFWERRTPKTVADAAGEPQGTMGVMQQIESGATKVEGEIETIEDLVKISQYLKKKKVTQAFLDATPSQFAKLMGIMQGNSNLQYDPFVNHQNDLMYLGYKGIKLYNGVTILFREWEGLTYGSEKLGAAYNFIITPSGKVNVTLNGQKKQMGYVNVVWFGNANDPYKFKRFSNENDMNCGNIEIKYKNKFAPVVLRADAFILGVVV